MAEVYEGLVSVYDKKADGTLLTIGKGDRKGEPYYKISFKVNGEYVNLMDFQGVTGGQQGMFRVEYYQKFDPKTGQPELYNDKPQYNLESIMPLGAPATPQNGAFSNPATPTPAKAPYNSELGAFQTALNGSVAIEAALITAKVAKEFNLSTVLDRAADFHRYLTTGETDELDQFLATGKKAGMEEVVEEVVEMPGPVAPENPEDHEFDGTF